MKPALQAARRHHFAQHREVDQVAEASHKQSFTPTTYMPDQKVNQALNISIFVRLCLLDGAPVLGPLTRVGETVQLCFLRQPPLLRDGSG